MPPKTNKKHYTQEDLDNAIEELKAGASSRAVSQKYHIPKTTLLDRIHGKVEQVAKKGPRTFLTPAEEEVIVAFVANAQKRALPVTNNTITSLVATMPADEKVMTTQDLMPRPDNWSISGD